MCSNIIVRLYCSYTVYFLRNILFLCYYFLKSSQVSYNPTLQDYFVSQHDISTPILYYLLLNVGSLGGQKAISCVSEYWITFYGQWSWGSPFVSMYCILPHGILSISHKNTEIEIGENTTEESVVKLQVIYFISLLYPQRLKTTISPHKNVKRHYIKSTCLYIFSQPINIMQTINYREVYSILINTNQDSIPKKGSKMLR